MSLVSFGRHARRSLVALLVAAASAFGQGGYNDDRVMIQGFLWESHQSGPQTAAGGAPYNVDWAEKWYDHVAGKSDELADAEFDLIWLPPPSQGHGAGYHPEELYNFDNSYGSAADHRELIDDLLEDGIEPIADVVINHRNGTGSWAKFENPAWPTRFICSDDEFWFQSKANLNDADDALIDKNERGAPDFQGSNYPRWDGARDLDHSSGECRAAIKAYLKKLREFGYRGWRYDMVKGFAPGYIAEYDFDSQPTFAVGEYWDGNAYVVSQWIDGTKLYGQADPALKACSGFDFSTYEKLRHLINSGQYNHLPALHFKDGNLDGLIAVNKDKAVTFLENHDTGFPQKQFDSFARNEKLMQAYAYILTHPGVPCVYWKHYFDWGFGPQIKAIIKARKYAGVNSGSFIKSEVHDGAYVAIVGDKPTESSTLIVKIGPGFGFTPDANEWNLETSGDGYAVWVRKSKKAATQATVDADKPSLPAAGE
jgi:alpha-amylase